jgi:hypothetical protein
MHNLYIAKIEGTSPKNDSRLQVRILPHMEGLENGMLPIWPFFFANQTITGKAGELVWCIADDEFRAGYILGHAGMYSWEGDYSSSSLPDSLLTKLQDSIVEISGQLLYFKNLIVTFWNDKSLHFVEKDTGAHYTAFSNGSFSMQTSHTAMQVVREDNGNMFSALRISRDEIVLTSKVIRLEGDVRLGTNPKGQLLVSPTSRAPAGGQSSSSVWA